MLKFNENVKDQPMLTNSPKKNVRKWLMYIIIRPSVGPFITGRISVFVKKLDYAKKTIIRNI